MTLDNQLKVTEERWRKHREPVTIDGRESDFVDLVQDLLARTPFERNAYSETMQRHVRRGLPWMGKSQLVQVYLDLCAGG